MDFIKGVVYYGIIGMLLEIVFTGTKSLFTKDWRGTAQTYFPWMLLIYGLGGTTLKAIHDNIVLVHNIYINTFLMAICFYVPLIYGFEFLTGWTLKKIIKIVPWEYSPSKFTIMGLIRLDYAPFWLIVSLVFEPLTYILNKATLLIK